MENREIARILRDTAQLLEVDGAIIGRYRSYERAARNLGASEWSLFWRVTLPLARRSLQPSWLRSSGCRRRPPPSPKW